MTKKSAIGWLLKVAGRHKFIVAVLMILQAVISGGVVCYALVMKYMIDNAVAKNRHGFFVGVILFASLILSLVVLRMVLRYLEESTRSNLTNALKERLFKQVLCKDYASVTKIHSEEWMNRMTSDTTVCADGLTDIFPGAFGMVVQMGSALIMIFVLQPKLSYVIVPCGILFLIVTLIFRRKLKVFHKQMQERDGEARVYLQERISSMLVLRVFGMEKEALEGAKNGLSAHKKARIRKGIVSNICNTGFSAAMNGMYLLGIAYCGYGILNGVVSYGTLTAIMQLIGRLQTPLANISGFVPKYYSMIASAERLMEVETYKEADETPVKTVLETDVLYEEKLASISFENVSFSYMSEDKEHVFENVNVLFHKGDYVAVTGLSGCGKSTLLKLLMGIYEPNAGAISLLTKGGEKLPIKEWRRLFAYVPQGNYLMGGTIREVITFGKENREDGQMTVEKALELACADFVRELPKGMDTLLGEKGSGLSEGQMQRIAIARALYADAPILILDEATSALDEVTERNFLEKMKQLTDKTVLIVTHRVAALDICNKRVTFAASENGSTEIRNE